MASGRYAPVTVTAARPAFTVANVTVPVSRLNVYDSPVTLPPVLTTSAVARSQIRFVAFVIW
jgi:hypothetical protein